MTDNGSIPQGSAGEDIAASLPGLADLINGRIGGWHDYGYADPPAPECKPIPPLGSRSANAVHNGHQAVRDIDEMIRQLHALRGQLVSELRQDEDLRAARTDAMLAERSGGLDIRLERTENEYDEATPGRAAGCHEEGAGNMPADIPADAPHGPDQLAFPPEHYGCPPWCTQNTVVEDASFVGHDSADGMPDWPQFTGYRHCTGRYIRYAAALDDLNPLSVVLDLNPGASEPEISVSNPTEDWATFTLDEAEELASEIRRMVAAYGPPACPPWCQDDHDPRYPLEDYDHDAWGSIRYASAPKDGQGHSNPYGIDLHQPAPEIVLSDGVHEGFHDVTTLSLREAAKVADAIAELVAAARAALASES